MRRYELADEQWAVIEPLLPNAAAGRPLIALSTRFEKLAVNFIVMLHLAFIERYLRVAFSGRT